MKPAALALLAALSCGHNAPTPTPQGEPPISNTPSAPPVTQDPTTTEAAPIPRPEEPPIKPPTPPEGRPDPVPAQGEPCGLADACGPGLTCVHYRGVGGNPLASCEIPCRKKSKKCPHGQRCVVIVDGPGSVCRSKE